MKLRLLSCAVLSLMLTACGGSDSDNNEPVAGQPILEPRIMVMEHQIRFLNSIPISSTCRILMLQIWSRKSFYWPVIKIKSLTASCMQMITGLLILNMILMKT